MLNWTWLVTRLKQMGVVMFVVVIGGALFAGQVDSSVWSITYAVRGDGALWETHVLDADRLLTYPTHDQIDEDTTHSISPDGRYDVILNDRQQLRIIERATGAVMADLTTGYSPRWSPDGRALIYNRYGGQVVRINYVLISDTGEVSTPELLTGSNAFETYNIDWAPQGHSLVFQGMDYGGDARGGLDVFAIEVGVPESLRNLSDSFGSDVQPRWSPDGSLVAYVSNRDGNQRLYFIEPDGTNLREITSDTRLIVNLAWSPDGTKLAFVNLLDGFHNLHIVDLENDNAVSEVLAIAEIENSSTLQWSPDGERIAFSTVHGEIYSVKLDGSEVRQLISGFGRQNLLLPG